jgi:probable phosphoglycerate mutase
MIRILLIRHGATDLLGHVLYGRMAGISLNADGFRQADRLASVLNSRYKIDEVVSGPLDRATQTAQPIAAAAELIVETDPGITEIDFGSWMGKSFEELSQLAEWDRYNRHRSTSTPPHGESLLHVQARAWQTLERLIHRRESSIASTLAIISHGDVIRCILLFLLGMSIDHIHRLEIAPASVSEILLGPGGPVVKYINEVPALK